MGKPTSFQSLVSTLEDPRQAAKVLYPLDEILLLCLCGVVSGCESFVDIAEYGEEKLRFLRRLSEFEHGIPSHDTLSTVFRALDPEPFNAVFAQWANELSGRLDGRVVAVDGKTVRGSKAGGATPLHLISAYCDDLRLVLGQRASAHKKNEIKDVPKLLDLLYLEGAIVTLDAMHCPAVVCETNHERGLPARHCPENTRQGRRLCAGPEGKPGQPLRGCYSVV